jgi:hypothetical protein
MRKVLKRFAPFACSVLWLAISSNAFAEPSRGDQKALGLMRFDSTFGLVFMNATISENGKPGWPRCESIHVRIKSNTGVINNIEVQSGLLGVWTYGAALVLPEGGHHIQMLGCKRSFGPGMNLFGPFARFNLKAGEILNLGTLVLVYEEPKGFLNLKSNGQWKIDDLNTKAAASLLERYPETFPKAKKQLMIALERGKPDAAAAKPQEPGDEVFCDGGGCRPVRKGCRIVTNTSPSGSGGAIGQQREVCN